MSRFQIPDNCSEAKKLIMKHCPVCDEHYDEEIIRFCTKDGSPLVDDEEPKFVAMPSENIEQPEDDLEATIIRRKPVGGEVGGFGDQPQPERIVIPTSVPEPQVRPRTAAAYYPPPPPQNNTAKTVVLTILGTLFVLACGAGLFWVLQKEKPANTNTNVNTNLANQNTNLNTNLAFDGNFNFNAASNFNSNYNLPTNLNANIKTPTPTPKPSPSTSPTPTSSPTPTPRPSPSATVRPSPTPTPRTGPRPPGANGNANHF